MKFLIFCLFLLIACAVGVGAQGPQPSQAPGAQDPRGQIIGLGNPRVGICNLLHCKLFNYYYDFYKLVRLANKIASSRSVTSNADRWVKDVAVVSKTFAPDASDSWMCRTKVGRSSDQNQQSWQKQKASIRWHKMDVWNRKLLTIIRTNKQIHWIL